MAAGMVGGAGWIAITRCGTVIFTVSNACHSFISRRNIQKSLLTVRVRDPRSSWLPKMVSVWECIGSSVVRTSPPKFISQKSLLKPIIDLLYCNNSMLCVTFVIGLNCFVDLCLY